MSTPRRTPRSRSAFAAAFLSLLFPGLGHAYAGALSRGLAFAAAPFLLLALAAGVGLRADRADLLGFVIQQPVLYGLLVGNVIVLVYRIIAAVDAWQVARFLNTADASGGGRLGRARLPLNPLSLAGLLAVVLVIAGGHLAIGRYNVLALNLVNCVFSEGSDPSCELPGETPDPDESPAPGGTATGEPLPTPEGTIGTGTPAPTLPPWDGKERLNVLMVGTDQRAGDPTFNTDTMIVVSVDPATLQVAMFQVPRDMVDVPVPANARSVPGVSGGVYTRKINRWFTDNRNRTDLWRGENPEARGFASLKAILGELYGLDIRYYVMVNFDGFVKVVDTLGGIQVNVQIPVAESAYPIGPGHSARIFIPAGPQQMTGTEALIYARSRHRAAGGDFDRGRRQQRVLVSLRDQMSARAIIANLPGLVDALKGSVTTDLKPADLPPLLALAESVDTKNIRSYVFSPSFYATEYLTSPRGYIITPNVSRIRRAVLDAFKVTPEVLARRERLGAEEARAWVLNGSGRSALAAEAADYFAYDGVEASAPNRRIDPIAKTTVVVYNGAEASMPATIAYLEGVLGATVTTAVDPKVTVDIIVTLGRDAPTLEAPVLG